jgi:hypothetical protein
VYCFYSFGGVWVPGERHSSPSFLAHCDSLSTHSRPSPDTFTSSLPFATPRTDSGSKVEEFVGSGDNILAIPSNDFAVVAWLALRSLTDVNPL